MPGRCARCGGRDLRKTVSWHKNVTDITRMPEPATICHVMHKCACDGCGAGCRPRPPESRGPGSGPTLRPSPWRSGGRNASAAGVAGYLAAFGVGI